MVGTWPVHAFAATKANRLGSNPNIMVFLRQKVGTGLKTSLLGGSQGVASSTESITTRVCEGTASRCSKIVCQCHSFTQQVQMLLFALTERFSYVRLATAVPPHRAIVI